MTPNREQALINAGAEARRQGKPCNPPNGSLVVQDAWIKGWKCWQVEFVNNDTIGSSAFVGMEGAR